MIRDKLKMDKKIWWWKFPQYKVSGIDARDKILQTNIMFTFFI